MDIKGAYWQPYCRLLLCGAAGAGGTTLGGPPVTVGSYGSFRKFGLPYFGVLIIRILLFRVLYYGPLFSENLIFVVLQMFVLKSDFEGRAQGCRVGMEKPCSDTISI